MFKRLVCSFGCLGNPRFIYGLNYVAKELQMGPHFLLVKFRLIAGQLALKFESGKLEYNQKGTRAAGMLGLLFFFLPFFLIFSIEGLEAAQIPPHIPSYILKRKQEKKEGKKHMI